MSRSTSGKSPLVILAVIVGGLGLVGAMFVMTRKPSSGAPAGAVAAASITTVGASASPRGACTPSHCPGSACDACTATNCIPTTDGCDRIDDVSDRKLCEEIYACFNEPANKCVIQGDSLKCWCGSNPTTCVTSNTPPTQANGKCLDKVFAGAKSNDAPTIRHRFVDPVFPLGRAVNLTLCRGTFCSAECNVP